LSQIKSNERELAGKIAQWFTEEIAWGGYLVYETDSPDKARFIKKLAVPRVFQIRVAKDITVLTPIIEKYQNYVASLKEILLTNANQKLHSWNEAEKMVSEILKEYHFEKI